MAMWRMIPGEGTKRKALGNPRAFRHVGHRKVQSIEVMRCEQFDDHGIYSRRGTSRWVPDHIMPEVTKKKQREQLR